MIDPRRMDLRDEATYDQTARADGSLPGLYGMASSGWNLSSSLERSQRQRRIR